ncbi:MAG: hypothetical protein IPO27_03990 [Bacteroidetes bacterium]|nr:hypothetical protein [Bacteroidota bacterium]
MKWMRFLILCFSITVHVYAQNIEQTKALMQQAYAAGNYSYCTELGERIIYFDTTYKHTAICHLFTGDSYFRQQDYANAASHFEMAAQLTTDDSVRTESLFGTGLSYMLMNDYSTALISLLDIYSNNNETIEKRKLLYTGVAYYYLNDFEKSQSYLNQFANMVHMHQDTIAQLMSITHKKTKRYKPGKAYTLSLLLPGMGQFYSGDIKNGINALLLVAGLTYLGYNVWINAGVVDAIISVAPWLQRYYYGNAEKARAIAANRLQLEKNTIMRNFLAKSLQ